MVKNGVGERSEFILDMLNHKKVIEQINYR